MAKLIKLYELLESENLGTVACTDADIEVNGEKRKARFGVFGIELSILLKEKTLEETIDKLKTMMKMTILNEINEENHEVDGIYYFQFTGTHFEKLDKKPDWANLKYS